VLLSQGRIVAGIVAAFTAVVVCMLILNARQAVTTRLCLAVEQGNASSVRSIIAGTPRAVNGKNDEGLTPLYLASAYGDCDVVELLCANGAYIDEPIDSSTGWTPLHIAALNGYHCVVKTLLSHSAMVNVRDRQGRTPLHLAAAMDRVEVVYLLVECGAALRARDGNGRTPVDIARENQSHDVMRYFGEGETVPEAKSGTGPDEPSEAASNTD